MKHFGYFFSFVLLAFFLNACQYDDAPVLGRLDKLESEVSALQQSVQGINSDLAALQALVDALNSRDQIEKVEQVEGGVKLTFQSGGVYTIVNGKSPEISIRQDAASGKWFWTVNGDFVKDPAGNRIPASSPDAPVIRVNKETAMYEIWFEEIGKWLPLGAGAPGRIFQNIEDKADEVVFTMADGSTIVIPKGSRFLIQMEKVKDIIITPNNTVTVNFSVIGGDEGTEVEAFGTGGYTVKLAASGGARYRASITAPAKLGGKVILVAVSGKGETAARILTFEAGVLEMEPNFIAFINAGGSMAADDYSLDMDKLIHVSYRSNLDCYVYHEDLNAQSWCIWANDPTNPLIPMTRTVTDRELIFAIAPNPKPEKRFALLHIQADGVPQQDFVIVQLGTADKPLPEDGRLDGETFNDGKKTSIIARENFTSKSGWILEGGGVALAIAGRPITYLDAPSPVFHEEIRSKGKSATVLVSPPLKDGLTRLSMKYIKAAHDNEAKHVAFLIEIKGEDGTVLAQKKVEDYDCPQGKVKYLAFEPEVEIKGDFSIVITDKCEYYKSQEDREHCWVLTELKWKPYIDLSSLMQ